MINQIKPYFNLLRSDSQMVKDSFILTAANFITAFMTFVSNILIASILGPENFGVYRILVIAFGVTIPFLFDFGATITLTKYVAEFQSDKKKIGYLNRSFLISRLFVFLTLVALTLIFREQISVFLLHDASYARLIIPAALILSTAYFIVFQFIVLGYENFKLYGVTSIIGRFIFLLLIVPIVYYTKDLYQALLVYAFAFFVSYALTIRFLLRQNFLKVEERFSALKMFKSYSLPMHVFYSIGYIATSAVVILTPFFSVTAIGYFSWAFQFYGASTFISASVASMLLPKISKMVGKSQRTEGVLRKVMLLYAPLAIIGVIGTLLFSRIFISFIAPAYLPGLLVFEAVMVYGFLSGFGLIYVSYLTAKGDTKRVAILQLLLNALLLAIGFVSLRLI
ncbi:hypothetical protein A3K63_02275 [Candidatus Micrarchaeota archaeon RBG_16_49_10]|nr:MAG: hypothetical protein A3K63_02275 [Candidatus Micrarchaeota archaeon RBG_16_49_10]